MSSGNTRTLLEVSRCSHLGKQRDTLSKCPVCRIGEEVVRSASRSTNERRTMIGQQTCDPRERSSSGTASSRRSHERDRRGTRHGQEHARLPHRCRRATSRRCSSPTEEEDEKSGCLGSWPQESTRRSAFYHPEVRFSGQPARSDPPGEPDQAVRDQARSWSIRSRTTSSAASPMTRRYAASWAVHD